MSSFSEWFRKLGHRLCKPQVADKFLVPQLAGNLETADARLFKKLVQKGKLAPFYPGYDQQNDEELMECPICCMHYKIMNKTRCCGQRICSECIVQIRIGCPFSGCTCPFCKKAGLDVEICEGKTEMEKREDMLDEQRFEECRLRQIAEATTCSHPVPAEGDEEGNEETEMQETEEISDSSPPATHQEATPDQDLNMSETAQTNQGDASSSQFTPGNPVCEHGHQYLTLSHRSTMSNLSSSELQQCEDYLGVCPEDLGLRLEEFNDLLLEQTLISSMIEMRKAERRQEKEQEQQSSHLRSETTQDQGASSSVAPVEDAEMPNATTATHMTLRSHSLPHPILHEEDNSPSHRSDEGQRWSFENVLRTVSNSSPFTFLTNLTAGEPSSSSPADLSSPFFSEQVQEQTREDEVQEMDHHPVEEPSTSTDSSATSTDMWKNLLNSFSGFGDVHTEFRMTTVRFDDPVIDAAVNRTASQPPGDTIEISQHQRATEAAMHVIEEISVTGDRATKTVAVENPDGSMALISVPCEKPSNDQPSQEPETAGVTPEDSAVMAAVRSADRSQVDAIEAADARFVSCTVDFHDEVPTYFSI